MGTTDRRGRLDEDMFSYQAAKDGHVRLYRAGRHVTTLAGKEAERFLARIAGLEGSAAQLVMAKATGTFKRGNER